MNYIGSKLTLLSFLEDSIKEVIDDISNKTFVDLFAGTGVVGNYFNNKVKKIIANDTELYSYFLNANILLNYIDHSSYINNLNNEKPVDGFIWKHYSPTGNRMYFTEENAKKIDAVRNRIFYDDINYLNKIQALSSLIESVDKVANTTSVYGAFLKKFKKTALKSFFLIPSKVNNENNNKKNYVFNAPAEIVIKKIEADILYLDPPYNARQYGANYHLLNTIVSPLTFEPQGKTGLPANYNKSIFCSKRTVKDAFYKLLEDAKIKHIFLSYNNEGLLNFTDIRKIMENFGRYNIFTTEYKRYKADNKRTYKATHTLEYLHYLEKK